MPPNICKFLQTIPPEFEKQFPSGDAASVVARGGGEGGWDDHQETDGWGLPS